MSNGGTSSTYRFILLGVVLVFASIFAWVYFRSRYERQQRRQRRRALLEAAELMQRLKPPLFDAHLGPEVTVDSECWGEIMPLAANHLQDIETEKVVPSEKCKAELVTTRVRVSVFVRMPTQPFIPRESLEEEELPYVELGVLEAELLQSPGAV
ncbi:hypothetical protein FB45DRAFT_316972 [Roridomyces roridus]|uniref:Uncharacterized protein n=1 Tax=Roridomyces roridus TaxID=1738132 RepID=A0AAD7B6R7_9AGAR|nr:hypothetical protein FB45DRAFT_316972 [Roridomyces roridus]